MTGHQRYRSRQSLLAPLVSALLVASSSVATAQVYVANSQSGTVSVIGTPGNTVVSTIPVGTLPEGVAITPDGKFVYVANQSSSTISKIDTTSNTVVGTIAVGGSPRGVAVSSDGSSVFVVVAGTLARFSVATNALTGSFPLPVGDPVDVAITPNGQFAYAVDKSQNICSLYPLNLTTGAVLTSPACAAMTKVGALAGSFPRGVALRPDGQFVYVTAFQDGALQVVRVSDNLYVGGSCVIPTGCPFGGPIGITISSDNKFAFTANFNDSSISIFALDPTSGLPSAPIKVSVAGSPSYLGVTADGGRLYVAHGASSVSVIDLKATPPSVIQTVTVGSFPIGIAVSPLASSGTPPPPALSATLAAAPATVTVGQTITLTMTVSNTGGSPATGVTASPLSTTGSGSAVLTSGPSPGSTTIGAGGSQAFTYTYSASAAGIVAFSGSASGGGVTSNLATSNAVTVQAPQLPPTLSVAPGGLSFSGEQGLPDPPSQSLTISNTGSGTLAWSAIGSTADGHNWLSLFPGTGSAPPPASLAVSTSTCGLAAGAYTGSLAVTSAGAAGSPQSIPLTLTVSPPGAAPPVPRVRACSDRPAYRTGDTFRLSSSLRQGAASNTGDAYVFAQMPGTMTFASLVLSQNVVVAVVGPAPVPFARNFSIFNFAGEFFSRPFDGSEPEGTYAVTAVLALPNSDPLVPVNQIAVGTFSLSFTH